jgi:hypothetical protein
MTWQPAKTAPKKNGRLVLAYIDLTPDQKQRTLAPTIVYWSKSGDFVEPCWTDPFFDRKLKAPLICWMEIPEPPIGEGL